jgi:hypothetical protein
MNRFNVDFQLPMQRKLFIADIASKTSNVFVNISCVHIQIVLVGKLLLTDEALNFLDLAMNRFHVLFQMIGRSKRFLALLAS